VKNQMSTAKRRAFLLGFNGGCDRVSPHVLEPT
jgi:hypothetical protein